MSWSVAFIVCIVIELLHIISGASSCNTVDNDICTNICDNFEEDSWSIESQRTYYSIMNETNYTYTISYNPNNTYFNDCIDDIFSSNIWIEIWPSYCCIHQINLLLSSLSNHDTKFTKYGWKFEIITDSNDINIFKLIISIKGDIPSITGSYWIYNDNNNNNNKSDINCIHKSIQAPNICYSLNGNINNTENECIEPTLLQLLTNSDNLIYFIIVIGFIIILFIILILITVCKQRKVNKLEQQIEDYYEDFRLKKNSELKSEHYPSIGGGQSVNNGRDVGGGPLHDFYNRYSVTMGNSNKSPITFDIKGVNNNQCQQQNIIPYREKLKTQSINNDEEELSVSYSQDKDETECLNNKQKLKSYSNGSDNGASMKQKSKSKVIKSTQQNMKHNELVTLRNKQHKYQNSMSYNVIVPSFEAPEDHQKFVNNSINGNDRRGAYL